MDTPNLVAPAGHSVQAERVVVEQWLTKFNEALQVSDPQAVAALFADDCHWRDLFAFTWSITPTQGAEAIASLLLAKQATVKAHGFQIAPNRTAPRHTKRAGLDLIEAIFYYETKIGRGFGVLRLLASAPGKAFQLMTNLHELMQIGHQLKRLTRGAGQ